MRNRQSISFVILILSATLWILLLLNPGNLLKIQHCTITTAGPSQASWQMLLAMNPISVLLTGWVLMVVAMMLPKLIGPIQHIYERSFKHRRLRSTLLFISGYVGVWVAIGLLMITAILGLNLLMPKSYLPAIGAGIIAITWQFSPIKQCCLNRGHHHKTLAAFGWSADRDALLFGISHGYWCVGSGWALMLWPMLLPQGHNFAMIVVTFLMISEHLEHPQVPGWRIDFRGKLFRMIVAQIQIKLL